MFILNGIVYASERPENIEITQATPLEDMMMILTFSTGEQRLFDATVLIGPAFQPLADTKVFNSCKVVNGVVTWMDEEIDCAPEFMYEHSFPYDREKKPYKTLFIVQDRPVLSALNGLYIDFLLPVSRPDINQSEHLNYIISRTSAQVASFFLLILPSKPGIYNCDIANERRMIYGTVKNAETRFNMAIQF